MRPDIRVLQNNICGPPSIKLGQTQGKARITPGQPCSDDGLTSWHASASSRTDRNKMQTFLGWGDLVHAMGWAQASWHRCQIIPVFVSDRSLWQWGWFQTQAISFMVTPWSYTKQGRTMNLMDLDQTWFNEFRWVTDPHLECFARSWQIFALLHYIGSSLHSFTGY